MVPEPTKIIKFHFSNIFCLIRLSSSISVSTQERVALFLALQIPVSTNIIILKLLDSNYESLNILNF